MSWSIQKGHATTTNCREHLNWQTLFAGTKRIIADIYA